jgi:hypothetical protein
LLKPVVVADWPPKASIVARDSVAERRHGVAGYFAGKTV